MSDQSSNIFNQIENAVTNIQDIEDLENALTAFVEALELKTELTEFPNSIFLYKTIRSQIATAVDILSIHKLAIENKEGQRSQSKKTMLPAGLKDYEFIATPVIDLFKSVYTVRYSSNISSSTIACWILVNNESPKEEARLYLSSNFEWTIQPHKGKSLHDVFVMDIHDFCISNDVNLDDLYNSLSPN